MIKYIFTVLIVLLIDSNLNAQSIPAKQPTFKIKVRLPGNKPSGGDSINVRYLKPYQPLGLPEFRPGEGHYMITDKNGDLEFTLPAFDEPIMMTLSLIYWGGYKSNSDVPARSTNIGQFFVEKTDNITLHILKTGNHEQDSFSFSGYGVEKYKITPLLDKLCGSNYPSGEHSDLAMRLHYPNGKADTTNKAGKIVRYCQLTDSLLQKKAAIIDRSGLSPKIKKILAYNFAPIYHSWLFIMYQDYLRYSKNSYLRSVIKENITRYNQQFSYQQDSLMALAPKYAIFVAGSDFFLQTVKPTNRKIKFEDMYHLFTTKYSGKQRELMIANLFMKGYGWRGTEPLNPHIIDSLMRDGDRYLTTPIIKNAYATKLKLAGGSPLFNTKFKDSTGKEVSLGSFKGKVMLLDMWFTGCGACMLFHQKFHKEGYPMLKDNKDFVYVSVSIDQSKTQWLKSISTNQYTSTDYINLNAPLGLKDPFLQYYERNTLPFLILVDKNGKIYTTNPVPEPKAVVELINEALKIPYTGK